MDSKLKGMLAKFEKVLDERAGQYGPYSKERIRVAAAVSGITGKDFTPDDITLVMLITKLVRSQNRVSIDDPIDMAGYLWLAYLANPKAEVE
jgi:hypothetical protein